MYVEDLVERLVGYGKYLFEPNIIQSVGWEYNFATSVANQLANGNALTEKQASLALKILKKYKKELEAYFNKPIDLENPTYRNPFRKITDDKSIVIGDHDGKKVIFVKFPWNQELISLIQSYTIEGPWKSVMYRSPLKHEHASWNHDQKVWIFPLKEENILWISNNLLPRDFKADEKFIEYLNDIKDIVNNIFDYAPLVVKENNKYVYKNSSQRIKALDTDNVLEFLFDAKAHGITAWDDEVDADLKNLDVSPVTSALLNTTNAIYIDNKAYGVDTLKDLIKYGGPSLIIIPGGSEVDHTMRWHHAALNWGITNDEMSVMFRMPNESHGKFNQYVKDNQLNNEIKENTKVVFVSTKIPKPLIKSGIRFNSVINLGYYRDLHFSMSVILQSTTNIVYYNDKQPHGVNVCPPQS